MPFTLRTFLTWRMAYRVANIYSVLHQQHMYVYRIGPNAWIVTNDQAFYHTRIDPVSRYPLYLE